MSDRSSHRQSSHTYTLLKPTGNGAFGMVYKAKDNQNGKIVAIKKVFQDQRYKNRELGIFKELKHDEYNIVSSLPRKSDIFFSSFL